MKQALDRDAPMPGLRVELEGLVQGVGFRPWVVRLARSMGIRGRVWNGPRGVTVEAHGPPASLDDFVRDLAEGAPRPAAVEHLSVDPLPPSDVGTFGIVASHGDRAARISIVPDQATCPDCLRELRHRGDRRFEYPFCNCTTCGPRFSIVTGAPYDRERTTMVGFTMCADCQREYDDPTNRRFHDQPNACPECGPSLTLDGSEHPLPDAARALRRGEIVAIKGIGGFHLACDATQDEAVDRLRARKGRDSKPFAVMVVDLAQAERLAHLGDPARRALTSPVAPIVLLPRRGDALAEPVAPGSRWVGLMLPYTPLHHLLLEAVGRPLVMTSGNPSEQPIEIDDDEATRRLGSIADRFLLHDRPIAGRADDSVVRVIAGAPTVLRRARGYVPRAIRLPRPVSHPVLACGAQLKNTVCIAVEDKAYLGPHHGDLDDLRTADAFEAGIERLQALLGVEPERVASDLHPDFVSTRYAQRRAGAQWIGVQHHHAHVASAMVEHRLEGEVLGLAFDGVGYGTDGTSWGGELLLTRAEGFIRLATLRPLRMPGGDAAVHEIWRLATALLWDAFDGELPRGLPLFDRVPADKVGAVRQLLARGLRCPPSHGVGRYFDAVAALGLALPRVDHEGRAAVLWEQAAGDDAAPYPFAIDTETEPWQVDPRPGIRQLVHDLRRGESIAHVSARFHAMIARAAVAAVELAVERVGSRPVVLTGGCFQNARLTERVVHELSRHPGGVHLHREVPPNDGGIALGQVLVASTSTEGDRPCV